MCKFLIGFEKLRHHQLASCLRIVFRLQSLSILIVSNAITFGNNKYNQHSTIWHLSTSYSSTSYDNKQFVQHLKFIHNQIMRTKIAVVRIV